MSTAIKRALLTGATGFVGRQLLAGLDCPHVLSRDPKRAGALGDVRAFAWNPPGEPLPAEAMEGVDAVFHLAGEPIAAGRWTRERKQRIRSSRVDGTRALVEAMATAPRKPRVLVSASAVGFYGDRADELLTEESAPAGDFLADVCRDWEREAFAAERLGVRVVVLRFGIVLGRGGGALEKMLLPFRLGLGGRLGSGRQWMPWVQLDDVVGLLRFAAENDNVQGAINTVGPEPVTNAQFTRALGKVLHRPAIFPVPKLALKVAVGEFAEVLLASQRVSAALAESLGYRFRHRQIEEALQASV